MEHGQVRSESVRRLGRIGGLMWDPHQGLWNWRLTKRLNDLPGGAVLDRVVVMVDTLLLAIRAVPRRSGSIQSARVLYVDCGVWEDGKQIRLVHEWLGADVAELSLVGYEANPHHWALAVEALGDIPNLDLRQAALVGPGHSGTVKLYLSRGGEGNKDDSLLRTSGEPIDVPAERLSEHLPARGRFDAILLRMNIEGAEEYVIADLLEAGQIDRVDGTFGMWDDLNKIDPVRDDQFRRTLGKLGIRPFTFNDRDVEHPFWATRERPRAYSRIRLWAIRRAMRSAIWGALPRDS